MRDLWWDTYQNRGTCYECDGCMRCQSRRDEPEEDWFDEDCYREDE